MESMPKKNLLAVKSSLKAGNVTVYGSTSCPWTIKQLNQLDQKKIAYQFKDCSSKNANCPDYVTGFPTMVITSVISGYTEL